MTASVSALISVLRGHRKARTRPSRRDRAPREGVPMGPLGQTARSATEQP